MAEQQPIKIPRDVLTADAIAQMAEDFRLSHDPKDQLPVPIEEIVEFGMRINIVVGIALKAVSSDSVDAYLTPDLQEIQIDQHTSWHVPQRARFSLAHECAHVVLHPNAYKAVAAQCETLGAYRRLMSNLDERELGWIEWQANEFAGNLLVPAKHLVTRFQEACTELGVSQDETVSEGDLETVIQRLRSIFDVSAEVFPRRY